MMGKRFGLFTSDDYEDPDWLDPGDEAEWNVSPNIFEASDEEGALDVDKEQLAQPLASGFQSARTMQRNTISTISASNLHGMRN